MKSILTLVTLCFIFIISISSCKEKPKEAAETMVAEAASPAVVVDTISLAQFNAWTNRWLRKGEAYTDTSLVRFFDMPVIDLSDVLTQNPASARFYMGLDSLGTNAYLPHIVLVGTDASGQNNLSRIYDMSRPCPPRCPK